jgi:ABC-type sugar transport system ATPase subunit
MAEIKLENVTKRFPDGYEAVRDMSLDIQDGEFMILVGPSGCGKSTALRMIAGLEDITDGELKIGGDVVNQLAPKERDIAMVFQNYALYPHMTVRENMGFALRLRGVDKGRSTRRSRSRRASSISSPTSTASRHSSRADSASAWRWAARSCATRRPSSWTSRSRTSTPSCAFRCAPRWRGFSSSSAPR